MGAKPEDRENQNPCSRYRQHSQWKRICKTSRSIANQSKNRWKAFGTMWSVECNGWGERYRKQQRANNPLQENW